MNITLDEIRSKAPEGATHYSSLMGEHVKIDRKRLWVHNGDMWKLHQYIRHPRELIRLQIKPL